MLTTLTWWGIGSIIAATILATIIATLITRKINKNSAIGTLKTVGLTGAATATLTYTGFYIYTVHVLGVRILYPSIWGLILIAICVIATICLWVEGKDPELTWEPTSYKQALTPRWYHGISHRCDRVLYTELVDVPHKQSLYVP